jgi:arsenate reductase
MKPKVLFLCTHNAVRSQMAEAFLRRYAGDRFEVYSAGLEPTQVHPYARLVMEELGFDMTGFHAKGLHQWLGTMHFGYLITVCSKAQELCPIFPGVAVRLYWPFDDPLEFVGTEHERLAKFRQVRDEIDERIGAWLKELETSGK